VTPAPCPVSDRRWREVLEDAGLIARPRPLTAWHYCPACARTVRATRVRWWAELDLGGPEYFNRNPIGPVAFGSAGRGASSRVRFHPPVALPDRRLARPAEGDHPVTTRTEGVTAYGSRAGYRTASQVRRPAQQSRTCRIKGANVGLMSTRQHPAQPLAPMSDRAFELLLKEGGITPTPAPRLAPGLATWHWCGACRRMVKPSRPVEWWSSRDGRSASNIEIVFVNAIDRNAVEPHPHARVRSNVRREVA
jgi:hypothetical protein